MARLGPPLAIALVDDHAPYRACMATLLRRHGLAIVAEAGDIAALRAWLVGAATPRPDLVLMDVQIPGGGPACLPPLLHAHPGLRVLALSSHDEPALVAAMLDAGAAGYLLKDDPIPELVEAIRAVAAGQRRLSHALPPIQHRGGPMSDSG